MGTNIRGTFQVRTSSANPGSEDDVKLFLKDLDVGAPNGDSGGGTVYRLREGIERFRFTDINNPASSAIAQREVAVCLDTVSKWPGDFSHIPGGAKTSRGGKLEGRRRLRRRPSSL